MDALYADNFPPSPNCNPHTIPDPYSAGCGWTEGFASAAEDWRLHDEIARKIRTARSTTPSAPTAALPLIDSRSPSEGLNDACEPYHALYAAVNLFGCFPP